MSKIVTRMGDGFTVERTEAELMKDIEDGTREASERAKVPALSSDEMKHLFEICKTSQKITGVEKVERSYSPMTAARTRWVALESTQDAFRCFRCTSGASVRTRPSSLRLIIATRPSSPSFTKIHPLWSRPASYGLPCFLWSHAEPRPLHPTRWASAQSGRTSSQGED